MRFVITSAGLVGAEGPTQCGAFDITYMSCLPNMIVMAPSDEEELVHMVATASHIDDRPVCFRYPRGAIVGVNSTTSNGVPIEVTPTLSLCPAQMMSASFFLLNNFWTLL